MSAKIHEWNSVMQSARPEPTACSGIGSANGSSFQKPELLNLMEYDSENDEADAKAREREEKEKQALSVSLVAKGKKIVFVLTC